MMTDASIEEHINGIIAGYKEMNLLNERISEYGFETDVKGLVAYEAGLVMESDI